MVFYIIANDKSYILITCQELRAADPTLQSQMYSNDPDGKGVGDDPIHVYCHMTTSLNKKITRLERIFEKII
jgi:hypothetical protein